MIEPGPAIFVQPHYDDVALSCGGTVAAFAEAGGKPLLVTVFAADVDDHGLTGFAQDKHRRWQVGSAREMLYTRREEDSAAACLLGGALHWMDHADAIYRGERYASDEALYGGVHNAERGFAAVLGEQLRALSASRPSARWFVPLGVGSHVDHQLVFDAGRWLAARGAEVWAYEDLPYVIHSPRALQARLDTVRDHLEPTPVGFDITATLARKLHAVAAYRSQLPVIFRYTDDFRRSLTEHAEAVGCGRPAERFWRLKV